MKERYSVLIVDDNKLICWGLEKMLSAQELLAVTTVSNGGEAIAKITGTSFHAVFLDIDLPDISGFEVLREIKRISPDTRVIMMTADNTDDNRRKTAELGAARFMEKPFSIGEVRRVLQEIVDMGKLRVIL